MTRASVSLSVLAIIAGAWWTVEHRGFKAPPQAAVATASRPVPVTPPAPPLESLKYSLRFRYDPTVLVVINDDDRAWTHVAATVNVEQYECPAAETVHPHAALRIVIANCHSTNGDHATVVRSFRVTSDQGVIGAALESALPVMAQERRMRVDCGRYQAISRELPETADARVEVVIQQADQRRDSVADPQVTALDCLDVTGDGVPELIVRTSTGGVHCCETLRIFSLGGTPMPLLVYDGGDAEGFELGDLAGDGRLELLLGDSSFSYFHNLDYASSPSLPLVACYTDDAFHDCTLNFPTVLLSERDDALRRLKVAGGKDRGAAVAVVALSELLGNEPEGVEIVRSVTTDPEDLAWLTDALPDIQKLVVERSKKFKRR